MLLLILITTKNCHGELGSIFNYYYYYYYYDDDDDDDDDYGDGDDA